MQRATSIVAAAALVTALAGCPGSDQPAWEEAFDASERGWFLSAWGPRPDLVYAVGGEPGHGVVMRFDGTAWTEVDLGLGADVPLLHWVYGFAPDDVWIVGAAGTSLHFDGAAWTRVETPTDEDLWGIWGAGRGDLWAVGGRGRADGQATLLHYDGSAWEAADVPPLQRAGVNAFFKVWGSSADNVVVVGQRGAVLRWDGSAWSEELAGASDDLIALWGVGPDLIVAVGGRGAGIVSVWRDGAWTTQSLAPLPGLNGVWMRDPGVAHLVGTNGTVLELDPATFEHEQAFPATTSDFHAVFGTGEQLVAVGGNLFAVEPPFRGIAFAREMTADD